MSCFHPSIHTHTAQTGSFFIPKGKSYLICILSLSVSLSHKIPYTWKHAFKLSVYTICCSQPPPHAGAHWHSFSCPPLHVPTGRVQHGSARSCRCTHSWVCGLPEIRQEAARLCPVLTTHPPHPATHSINLICHDLL